VSYFSSKYATPSEVRMRESREGEKRVDDQENEEKVTNCHQRRELLR